MPFPDSYFYPQPPNSGPDYYIFPSEFTAGDYFQFFYVNGTLYPSSKGWTFQLSLSANGNAITLNSTTPGDFLISEIPANTAAWDPGRYVAQLYAVNNTLNPPQRITIFQVYLNVLPNVAAAKPEQDLRTHAQKVLDSIEATLEGRATDDIMDSIIGDTTFRRLTPEQLMDMRSRYLIEVRKEKAKSRTRAGLASGRNILARFSPPT